MPQYVISTLYKFVTLDNYEALREPFIQIMKKNNIRGTILLAKEGINGTVAGSRDETDNFIEWLKSDPRLAKFTHKESYSTKMPFYRSKVKLKKEIVTMGIQDIDPKKITGTYVKPAEWNKLISNPDVTVIDTRNDYEIGIGTFKNATNPMTQTFRQFPQYAKDNLESNKHQHVAMFCTGGIRCEKATAYLKSQGFENVYHLEGGILKYLEDVPKNESMWEGECFVFDGRVAVDHSLKKGRYDQCYACRWPITEEDKKSDKYNEGVSCPRCYDIKKDEVRKGFIERKKQIELAKQRGEEHIGSGAAEVMEQQRDRKRIEKLKHK